MKNVFRFAGFILCMLMINNCLLSQKDILDSRVEMTLKKANLKDVFENLEYNNNLVVSYSSSIVDISLVKQFDTTDYLCSDLFSALLQEQAVRAISRGRKILIIPDPNKNVTFSRLKPRNYYTINGYVKDRETGESLIGASVYNPLTNRGTITNEFGFYSLTMPEGKQTVNYSYVGFNPISRTSRLNKKIRADIFLSSNIKSKKSS